VDRSNWNFGLVPQHARFLLRRTWLGKYFIRKRITDRYLKQLRVLARAWRTQETEISNFYYALEDSNVRDLSSILSVVLNVSINEIEGYIAEIQSDLALREHFRKFLSENNMGDSKAEYARRVGWYVIARSTKPTLIVESGVSDGIGSCVLSLALMNNKSEGKSGKYIGIDINPNSGKLYARPYRDFGELIFSDSHEALSGIEPSIDLFICDSNHDTNYEYEEYIKVISKLSPKGIILGDNSHASPSLRNFSIKYGRNYIFFKENPKHHWYPGAGIGISYN